MHRRHFLAQTTALALSTAFTPRCTALAADPTPAQPHAAKLGWRVSVQQFTYRRFSLFEALDKLAAVGLRHIELRSNVKLDPNEPGVLTDENMPEGARRRLKAALADYGISIPSVFADFTGQPDQARRVFAFWKDFGTEIIVSEPPADLFDLLEKLCDEYQMRLAVHNHQRGHSQYWSPDLVLDVSRNRSPRLGAACDNGQWARSGLDPVECLRKLQGRIVTFHLKDIAKRGEPQSPNTVIGIGEADCAATLAEFKRLGYQGLITIDFELDTPALQADMARNIAFVEEQAGQLLAQ